MASPPFEEGTDEWAEKVITVTDTLQAYVDPQTMTLVTTFSKASIREASGLPVRDECDVGTFTAMKFSAQFICKATGERIDITSLQFSSPRDNCPGGNEDRNWSDNPCNEWTEISWDPNNP